MERETGASRRARGEVGGRGGGRSAAAQPGVGNKSSANIVRARVGNPE